MKQRILFIAVVSLFLSLQMHAQNVPTAVVTTFNTMFSGADDAKWVTHDKGWEAEFTMGNGQFEATFSPEGEWLGTEKEIDIDALPAAVRSVTVNYPGYKIKEAVEVWTPVIRSAYEILIEDGDHTVELLVDTEGQVLDTKSTTGDDDNQDK